MGRPWGVVVSAQASASDRKAAPRSEIVAKTLRRSLVDRASRSRRVTRRTSPVCRAAIALERALRSVTAPLIFSANTQLAPAALRAASCPSRLWLSVETRAYPIIILVPSPCLPSASSQAGISHIIYEQEFGSDFSGPEIVQHLRYLHSGRQGIASTDERMTRW